MIGSFFKNIKVILVLLALWQIPGCLADEDQRITEQLASDITDIPLRTAMGIEAYDDAMKSGKYAFVGNSKCRLCHREFFLGRKRDPHDHTTEKLVPTNNEKNPKCIVCHSTGYGMPSGFEDMEKTPRLANVQCEGCHGPGNVHIELAKDKVKNKERKFTGGGFMAGADSPKIMKKMCQSCHTDRWNRSYTDANFEKVYNSYKKADPKRGGR